MPFLWQLSSTWLCSLCSCLLVSKCICLVPSGFSSGHVSSCVCVGCNVFWMCFVSVLCKSLPCCCRVLSLSLGILHLRSSIVHLEGMCCFAGSYSFFMLLVWCSLCFLMSCYGLLLFVSCLACSYSWVVLCFCSTVCSLWVGEKHVSIMSRNFFPMFVVVLWLYGGLLCYLCV